MSLYAQPVTILGIDLGTTAVKVAVFGADGSILGTGEAAYPTLRRGPGWSEQRPEDWWSAVTAAIRASGADERVEAVGLTGQMQDLICLDAHGEAVRPAILYNDVRAGTEAAELDRRLPDWPSWTGNEQDATSIPAKLCWLRHHEPEALEHTGQVLLGAPAAVLHRAGGDPVVDLTTASTTGLLDVQARGWSEPLLAAVGLASAALPRLIDGPTVSGSLSDTAARELGLRAGIPLVHALGDAGAATHGIVGLAPGSAYLYLGTSGWIAEVRSEDPAWMPGPVHSLVLPGWTDRLLIGAVLSAGGAADWARRVHLGDRSFEAADRVAGERLAQIDPAALPLCLPSLQGARTPIRDSAVRGTLIGMTPDTTAEDLYLAVLLGVAIDLRLAAERIGSVPDTLPVIGGAARSPVWRQLLADAFGAEILTSTADPARAGVRSAADWAATATGGALELPAMFETDAGCRTLPRNPIPHARLHRQLELYRLLGPTFADLAH